MIHDALVIGGGIHGAAVARDAALRGVGVLLLEARDLASGTSSRTSKLVHGGIRYLETGRVRLVRESLRERAVLLEIAADYVRPLPFLIPHYRGEGRPALWIRLGLALYGRLAGRHPLAAHRSLGAEEVLALEPGLRPEGLAGASLFWDAQMDDAGLCVAVALDAERAGAEVRTRAPVTALRREGSVWTVRYRDSARGECEAQARFVVNAAGPWAEEVRAMAPAAGPARMRRTRGTHVVLPALTREHALLLTARDDGRVFFVLPWGRRTLVGTTDADDGTPPEAVGPDPADIRYLLRETERALPGGGPGRRPLRAFAGVRSLVRGGGTPWANTREDRVVEEEGMLTLIGGKYTTHRSVAERVVDRMLRRLELRAGPCRTAEAPVGCDREATIAGLARDFAGRVALGGGLELREAEVVQAVRHEKALHLEDLLLRRTRLWLDGDALRRAAGPAAGWMAPHRGWSEAERAGEVAALEASLDAEDRVIRSAAEPGGRA